MALEDMIGRAINVEREPWTILGKADWGMYYYLGNPDHEEVIVRGIAIVNRAIDLGAEVSPD